MHELLKLFLVLYLSLILGFVKNLFLFLLLLFNVESLDHLLLFNFLKELIILLLDLFLFFLKSLQVFLHILLSFMSLFLNYFLFLVHFGLEVLFELENPLCSNCCLVVDLVDRLDFVLLKKLFLFSEQLIFEMLFVLEHFLFLHYLLLSTQLDLVELYLSHFILMLDAFQLMLQFNLIADHVVKYLVVDLLL